jgi:hypothetical protein
MYELQELMIDLRKYLNPVWWYESIYRFAEKVGGNFCGELCRKFVQEICCRKSVQEVNSCTIQDAIILLMENNSPSAGIAIGSISYPAFTSYGNRSRTLRMPFSSIIVSPSSW